MKKHFIFTVIIGILVNIPVYSQNFLWAKSYGGNDSDYLYGIYIDDSNDIFITGYLFSWTAYFENCTLSSNVTMYGYLAKIKSSGDLSWVSKISGDNYNYWAGGDDVIKLGNSVYLLGHFTNHAALGGVDIYSHGSGDVFLAKYNDNGDCLWAKAMGGANAEVTGGICSTDDGNLLICGYFSSPVAHFDTVDLYNNDGPFNQKTFIAKFDTNGNCLWARQSTGESSIANKLCVDSNNIYVVGGFSGSISFGDTVLQSIYGKIYLASFDLSGNLKWLRQAGGPVNNYATSVCLDNAGNIYITGYFSDTAMFGTHTLISIADTGICYTDGNAFIAKYDTLGNCIWAKAITCDGGSEGLDISSDGVNGVYVAGKFRGTAIFGPYQITSASTIDMFVARYDSVGNCLGVKTVAKARGCGVSVDKHGECIVAGYYTYSTNFDTFSLVSIGGLDIFLAKMTPITGIAPPPNKTHNGDQLVIYANPNSGNCTIMVPDDLLNEPDLVLNIYDLKGRLIYRQNLDMNLPEISLDLGFEAKGTYLATLDNGGMIYTGMIVFE